jgi:hypothetical protein
MTAFEIGTVESCRSLGIVPADRFRPVALAEVRPAWPLAAVQPGFAAVVNRAATRQPSLVRKQRMLTRKRSLSGEG